MGERGPKKEPTVLTLAKGNPGKRPVNISQPWPEEKIPPCPRHLDAHARKEWRWISKHLHKEGLLTIIDKAELALYCQAYGRWVEAEEKLKTTPLVVMSKRGPIKNPWLAIADRAMAQVHRHLQSFGMSPSARSSIRIPEQGEGADPWQEFLERKKLRDQQRRESA